MIFDMTILLTNDDGIEAEGLKQLTLSLSGLDELVVAAPLNNNSGVGHAISIHTPVTIHEQACYENVAKAIAVAGTPADAVKFALLEIMEAPPALVVSGINNGPNVGLNVLYSGTLGAAFEAVIGGVSAVAVSVDRYHDPVWEAGAHYARVVVEEALRLEGQRRAAPEPMHPFCLNLNVPSKPKAEVPHLRITRHGSSGFREYFHQDHGGPPHEYMIGGEMHILDPDHTFDAAALAQGVASLTPLQLDLTDEAMMDLLERKTPFARA